MTNKLIDKRETLNETYNELLRRKRAIEVIRKEGHAVCSNCKQKEPLHLFENGQAVRCDVYATSTRFYTPLMEVAKKIEEALSLLEKLFELTVPEGY